MLLRIVWKKELDVSSCAASQLGRRQVKAARRTRWESGEHARKAGSERNDSKKAGQDGAVKLTPSTALMGESQLMWETRRSRRDPLERLWKRKARRKRRAPRYWYWFCGLFRQHRYQSPTGNECRFCSESSIIFHLGLRRRTASCQTWQGRARRFEVLAARRELELELSRRCMKCFRHACTS